ncbi:MAG: hypothetical protein H8E76_02635 [Helicobacteraceae bacterium]|nr:hypothetical protein [Candidatus Sulfurimonas ponti]MBL6973828.1 hypothetical protein [Sulfurimonas sp.]
MENPFESGHIKNYILLYVSVIVIMVLFFIASSLFNDVQDLEKKVFNTEVIEEEVLIQTTEKKEFQPKFQLLDKAY